MAIAGRSTASSKSLSFLLGAGLVLFCLLLYRPVQQFDFVNWDDPVYVSQNPAIRSFHPENVKAWWTRPVLLLYTPLTLTSYALDYQRFQNNPAGYHQTNLWLHILNVLLVGWLLQKMGFGLWTAALAALCFGVHPAQVESVAWISERKTLLFAFFSLLSWHAFLQTLENTAQKKVWAGLTGLSAVCALLSKPTAVMLPVIFMAYAYFRGTDWKFEIKRWGLLLVAAALLVAATLAFYPDLSAGYRGYSWQSWIVETGTRLFLYTRNLIWPIRLQILYDLGKEALSWPVALLLLLGAGFACFRILKARPFWGFWVFWILLWLLPVSSIFSVPVGDRHLYLPVLGLLGLLLAMFRRWPVRQRGIFVTLSMVWIVWTHLYLGRWQNSETLWRSVLAEEPQHYRAQIQLANAYLEAGQPEQAETVYRKVIDFYPLEIHAYVSLTNLYLSRGELEKAYNTIQFFSKIHPDYPEKIFLEATLADMQGRKEESAALLDKALVSGLQNPAAFFLRGRMAFDAAQPEEAVPYFRQAWDAHAGLVEAGYFLGVTYNRLGRWAEAIAVFEKMRRDAQAYPGLSFQLGYASLKQGDRRKAESFYRESTRRDPDLAEAC